MKALIVEDELIASQNLQRILQQLAEDIQILAILQSVEETIEWFRSNPQPDVLFLDIHLADGASFAIFDEITINCPIIFTTAYDEYALKAFEVNSIDYLLKPINQKNLERALNKLRTLTANNEHVNNELITKLIANFKVNNKSYKSGFLIPYKDKFIPLQVSKIDFFYTENKMVTIMSEEQMYHLDTSLEDIASQLDPQLFFRANRQFIVARKAIKDISVWFGSKVSINLFVSAPEKIIVSKARVSEFKTWFTS